MEAVDQVVLGAGAVGMAVADALVAREESVRVVSRSGLREPLVGVQSVAGDVTDPAFAASASYAVEQTVRWYRGQAIPSSAADHKSTQPVSTGWESNRGVR
jgi:nucleoside-diphosphate-sugar epimerase